MRSETQSDPTTDALLVLPARNEEQNLDFEILLSYLRQAGLEVTGIHTGLAALDDVALMERIEQLAAPLVYWHLSGASEYSAAKELWAGKQRDGITVAGGEFATRHDLPLLRENDALDAVVRGETEGTLTALAGAVRRNESWWSEPGISHRRNGEPRRNAPRPLLERLSALPRAADDFCSPTRSEKGRFILFGRGCNSDCQYCGLQVAYRGEYQGRTAFWRARDPSAIVDELEYFHAKHGVRRFYCTSHVFFGYDEIGSGIVEEVAREVRHRGLSVELSFVTHAAALHRNLHLLPLLKEAGLYRLTLGIDSGLKRALDLYRVPCTQAQVFAVLRALHENQIVFRPAFIFYDPYLSFGEIRENLSFIRAMAPYFRHMGTPYSYFLDQLILNSVLQVHYEMPIYERLLRDGLASAGDPLRESPKVGFSNPQTGRFFRVHQGCNTRLMRGIRPFLFHPAVIHRFPFLELFPLDLLERLAGILEEQPEIGEKEALERILSWAAELLAPDWDEMLDLIQANEQQRGVLRPFLAGLKAHEN